MLVDQILPHAGPAYEPYAQATFDRCMRILTMQLAASGAPGMSNGQHPPIEPEKEFVICALDLISGLAESLGPAMEAYVGRSNLRVILVQCCGVSALKACPLLLCLLSLFCCFYFRSCPHAVLWRGISDRSPAFLPTCRASQCSAHAANATSWCEGMLLNAEYAAVDSLISLEAQVDIDMARSSRRSLC